MSQASTFEAKAPVPATALVVDLRNFTPNLKASLTDAQQVNVFCRFLAEFHALCLDTFLVALPPENRRGADLHIGTTGDGVVACFLHPERHAAHGYLSALVLQSVLQPACVGYNREHAPPRVARVSFGIGLESGTVWEVRAENPQVRGAAPIETYVGHCINVASRAQEASKNLHRARTIIAAHANQLLARELWDVDYSGLVASTRNQVNDARYLAIEEEMNEVNRRMCLGFIHLHSLRGVDRPIALFRVSESTARIGNPRFDALLNQLVAGNSEHAAEVRAFIERMGSR